MTIRRMKYRLLRRCRVNKLPVARGFRWRTNKVGAACVATLKVYQRFVGIPQSGEFDRRTMDALFPAQFRHRIAAKALAELGTHEWPSGSNDGPVMKFIEPFIGHVHTAWCALLGAWSAWQAGFPKDKFWSDVAWVDSWEREARDPSNKHIEVVSRLHVGRGDFALMDWENNNNPDHLAIVTAKVGPLAQFSTVEGNVGDYGGSVMRKTRLVTQTHCFVRLNRYARR